MNVISKNKVQVFTSSELKSVLEGDNDYNYILATDDSYFNDGIMTLPVGRKFLRMTSKKITNVIIPEN